MKSILKISVYYIFLYSQVLFSQPEWESGLILTDPGTTTTTTTTTDTEEEQEQEQTGNPTPWNVNTDGAWFTNIEKPMVFH